MLKRRDSPADFCLIDTAPESRLSQFERLSLLGGEELRRAVSWLAGKLDLIQPNRLPIESVDVAALRSAAAFYEVAAHLPLPPVKPPAEHTLHEVHGLPGGSVTDLTFASTYRPLVREELLGWGSHASNRKVHARIWRHAQRASFTLVMIHGWTMGDQRVNSLTFLPGFFYRLGIDVVLIELPFHGRRRVEGRGGELPFISPRLEPYLANEAVRQAVWDARTLSLLLKQWGAGRIGCIGMSLGAYVGALWATYEKLDTIVHVVPLVDMSEVIWSSLRAQPSFKAWVKDGLRREVLNRLYTIHSPLRAPSLVPPEATLMIAGMSDPLVPAAQTKALWRHLGEPKLVRLKGGHVSHITRSKAFREIGSFYADAGIVDAGSMHELLSSE